MIFAADFADVFACETESGVSIALKRQSPPQGRNAAQRYYECIGRWEDDGGGMWQPRKTIEARR